MNYTHLCQVVGGALLIIGLILLWNYSLARQIARRKQAEAELARERGFLKTLIATIPDLIWLKDPDGVYLACNPRFEQFFGAAEADIVGKTDYDFVSKELADFFREHDRIALEKGEISINEEDVIFASDGHCERLETTKTSMCDALGHVIGVMGIGHNITERKRTEQALRESHEKYQHLMDDIGPNFVIFSYRVNGVIEYLSNGFAHVFGFPAQSAVGLPWQRVIPWQADSLALALETHARFVSREQDETELELCFLHPNHGLRLVELTAHPVRDADGQFTHVEGILQDITERKHLEETLRTSQEMFLAVIDLSPVPLALNDGHGTITLLNRAFVQTFGYDIVFLNRL